MGAPRATAGFAGSWRALHLPLSCLLAFLPAFRPSVCYPGFVKWMRCLCAHSEAVLAASAPFCRQEPRLGHRGPWCRPRGPTWLLGASSSPSPKAPRAPGKGQDRLAQRDAPARCPRHRATSKCDFFQNRDGETYSLFFVGKTALRCVSLIPHSPFFAQN